MKLLINSNKSQKTIKFESRFSFTFSVCVCVLCGFWSMFTYIISFDSHNNSMRQTGVITLHFIEKHIEILKD